MNDLAQALRQAVLGWTSQPATPGRAASLVLMPSIDLAVVRFAPASAPRGPMCCFRASTPEGVVAEIAADAGRCATSTSTPTSAMRGRLHAWLPGSNWAA
jgi:hypothetical protein